MTVWAVVWVVLMCLWLFAGLWWGSSPPSPPSPAGWPMALLPWLCVLILGLIVLGALPAARL